LIKYSLIYGEVEVYPLVEANRVLQRLKDRQVCGGAVLEVSDPSGGK